ncbi:MAG: DNA primase [Eubacterium sp.]|nr:DNA primase [Eubacterium sp.]MDY3774948.1 DNA primase [Eubacterium sp.]
MYYSEDFVEEVRERNDIVDVISSYVNLKRSGSNYVGLCPFHNEKTASFSVSGNKQMYYCFGCGAGGNVFTFLMEYENLTFPEALGQLAERVGMKLPEHAETKEEKRKRSIREQILEIYKIAANYYYAKLNSERGKEAKQYLLGRQLSEETIRHFGLGYSDKYSNDLYQYMKKKGYDDALLKQTGLFQFQEAKGVYDKFWNRVMFPIMDRQNKVIAFGGRVMGDGKPKYLNSPETMIFDKSRNLFGLNFVHGKQAEGMIICEGYMDVIALHQAGFTNAVASLGTAFTSQQSSLLKRYTDTVYLCYDSDGAGVKAALRAIPMLKEAGISVKVINMRPYKDPDEFIKALSKEEFQKRIEQAQNSFFYEIDQLQTAYSMDDPEEKTRFMNEAAKKCLTFENEIERNNYIEAFARQYAIRSEDFRNLVSHQAAVRVGIDYEKIRKERQKKQRIQKEDGILKVQGVILTWIADDVGLFPKISKWLQPEDFFEEPYGRIATMLYEQARTGKISPAQIISNFESKEEQSLAAGIFNKKIQQIKEDSEREKALNEMVKTLKRASLDKKSREITDLSQLQKIIMEKKQLETLHITLT